MACFDDGAVERDLQVASANAVRECLARKQMEVPGGVKRQPVVLENVTGKPVQIGCLEIQHTSRREMVRNPPDQLPGIGYVFDDLLADDGIEPFLALHFLDRAFHEGYAAFGKV